MFKLPVPLSPAERYFCVLMEADPCVRCALLEEMADDSPEIADEVARMMRRFHAADSTSSVFVGIG